MDFGTLLTVALSVGSSAIAAIVWLVRIEGRVNVLAAKGEATEKRVDGLEERIAAQLDRIEKRLDEMMRSQ